jgi:hypothetical protein
MLWIYVVATVVGGGLAAIVFRYLNPGDVGGRRKSTAK